MTTENDKKDTLIEAENLLIDYACRLVALSKQKGSGATQVVYVGSDGSDEVMNVYDFIDYTWKTGDTMDRVAEEKLSDASLGTVIAYFNKIANETEIEAGTVIKLPVLQESSTSSSNRIYASPEAQDSYGKDILIDDTGDFASSLSGDFEITDGKENLYQALALRLTTASRKRIRLVSYGIRAGIGDNMAVSSYLMGSIEQTIKADPRVKSIEEITFKGDGDKLYCEVTYTDINGQAGSFEGEI